MSLSSKSAFRVALRAYLREILKLKTVSFPALLTVGIGNVFVLYIPPLIVANMIRHFDNDIPNDWHSIMPYILLLGGSWALGELIFRLAFIFLNQVDSKGMKSLYNDAVNQLLRKDMTFFNDNFAGSLTKKVNGYSRRFEPFMDTLVFEVFGNLLPLIFASVILWIIEPLLVLTLIGFIGLALICMLPLIKRRQRLTADREDKANVVSGHVSDILTNISMVQAFGREKEEQKRHEDLVSSYITAAKKSWDYHVFKIDMVAAPFYVITNVIGLALAIILSDSTETMATLFVVFSYFGQALRILFEFNRTYRNIENSVSEAAQFSELLFDVPKINETPGAKPLKIKTGKIEFKNVDFAYQDSKDNELLLSNFNLRVQPGEKVALVGHSGGGKTTITKLILRYNDVSGGQLLIDDQPIDLVTLRSLRHSIAYVPQEPMMFHRSVADNIRYGNLEASNNKVIIAAKHAHALEFIENLPDGLDTLVGERGVKLSGGQRQRIAIARAILKDAPILILDEATSALDSESEALIQDALWKLMQGRTTIVVAHRLSTIQKMDRIIVLSSGHIAEQGTHKELIKDNGQYAKLWAHQSGGFIDD